MLLAYYFGWRGSTIRALFVADITFLPGPRIFRFSERFSKGCFGTSRLFRILEFPAAVLPGLTSVLTYAVQFCPASTLFLACVSSTPAALDVAL